MKTADEAANDEAKELRSSLDNTIISDDCLNKLKEKVNEQTKYREELKKDSKVAQILKVNRQTDKLVEAGELTRSEANRIFNEKMNETLVKEGMPVHSSSFNPYDESKELTIKIGDKEEESAYRDYIFRIDDYHVLSIGYVSI